MDRLKDVCVHKISDAADGVSVWFIELLANVWDVYFPLLYQTI
jgi:hypothetical protein